MTAVLRLMSRRGEPSRRVRRMLVVLAVLAIPGLAVLTATGPRQIGLALMVVLVALLFVPLIVLTEFRRNIFRGKGADERERQRRDDAYRFSYRIVELSMPLAFLVPIFARELDRIPGWDWLVVLMPLVYYVLFLPYMVFAWREPDSLD